MRNRHANWIMPRRTRALPERARPFSRRLVPLSSGEPVRPRVTRYGPSVAHVSRQNLLHQHVGRLDANPDHPRQQAHHGVWSITGRLLDAFEASILDLADLITDQPTALHVTTQLSQRVGRYWLPLGRAQFFKAPGGSL